MKDQNTCSDFLILWGAPDIKIITGVRRSGKSELMKAYIRRIREIQPEANIIFVDFFDLKYERVTYSHHFPLRFRSGGFLFDSPYGLSIRKLSPRAPRFILSPRIRVFSSFLQV